MSSVDLEGNYWDVGCMLPRFLKWLGLFILFLTTYV
jgi:hypothetical protein